MNKYHKLAKIALTLLFAICLYVFWALPYRSALSYQEQFQLFLFDTGYLAEHLSWPGGIATYISEFFVQMYNNYWIGAAIVTSVLVVIQLLMYAISKSLSARGSMMAYVLSFVPAVALWVYMGDINHMPSFAVSIIIALAMAWWFASIRHARLRILFIALAIPVAYWIAGASVYLLTALICLCQWRGGAVKQSVVVSLAACVYTALLIWLSTMFVSYAPSQIWTGINYYRLADTLPLAMVAVWAITTLVIGVCAWMPSLPKAATIVTTAIVAVSAVVGVRLAFDTRVHDMVEYDYLLRTSNWYDIISKSERHAPETQLSVCTTNLALGMTDQLTTRAFDFYQNGPEGLFPAFNMDANTAMVLSELYFHLGMINSAQRLAFEAMESNPNYKKSVRYIKRLAETNMIRGNKAVAEKYLKLLDKTMMYGKWAKRTRELLYNPDALNTHPLYGHLKSLQVEDDFLFSETEVDKIMGQLYTAHPDNKLAMQYLLMYPLMQRDINKFMQYLSVVQERTPVRSPLCQQAVAFAYVQAGKEIPQGVIDPVIYNSFRDFASTMSTSGKDSPALDRFRGTLWYYLVKGN